MTFGTTLVCMNLRIFIIFFQVEEEKEIIYLP